MSRSSLGFRFVIAFAALMCASAVGQNNFKVLHGFAGYPNDGMHPTGPVVFDKAGNMYGTAPGGGNQTGCGDWGCGVVYELSPDGQGSWTESILYNFCQDFDGLSCLDGSYPSAGLAVDSAGDLYGITELGGTGYESGSGGGVAFELSPPKKPGQLWIETVLYSFCSRVGKGECLDGGFGFPSQVVFDRGGTYTELDRSADRGT